MRTLDPQLKLESIWCVIPVYNNAATIRQVALACREKISNVLVVDDGSTDAKVAALLADTDILVIRHEVNLGKGKALLTALDFAAQKQARYMITLDGDGQHLAADLEKFFLLLQDDEDTFLIGCRDFSRPNIPHQSKFGRDLANFWLRVETGVLIKDCQSGFRAYPVKHFSRLALSGARYDFETEALARAAWAGLRLKTTEIDVYYPEKGRRVSSFHPFLDNLRISWMHSRLVLRHLLPFPHKKLVAGSKEKIDWGSLLHPVQLIRRLLQENASPSGLAASAAVGIFLATLPLLFVHTISILYVTGRLHLNKIMAVSIQNLCNPPFVPFLCIEIGHRMRYGTWLTSISREAFLGQVPALLADWLLGSLVIAPVLALIIGAAVYFISKAIFLKRALRG